MSKTTEQQKCEEAYERMKRACEGKTDNGKTDMPDWMVEFFKNAQRTGGGK